MTFNKIQAIAYLRTARRDEHRRRQGQRQAPAPGHRGVRQARPATSSSRSSTTRRSAAPNHRDPAGLCGDARAPPVERRPHHHRRDRQPLRPRPDGPGGRLCEAEGARDQPHCGRQPGRLPGRYPDRELVRQVLGAISRFDKAMPVAKLRGARDRKRATGVKVEGRRTHQELRPEVVAIAHSCARRSCR